MKKILVIEDEQDIRDSIQEIVEMAGYEVTTLANGAEGIKTLMHNPFDLIICDIMMPEMDGFSLLTTLKKDPNFVTPFIFLTAKVQSNDLRNGMNLGADDYLHKPFKSKDLLTAIEARLSKHEKLNKLQSQKAALLEKTIELMVGHEFKNPMNGIINFNTLIAENAISLNNEKLQSLCSYLHISADRLLNTYDKINTYYTLQKALQLKEIPDEGTPDPHHIMDVIKSVLHKHGRDKDLDYTEPKPPLFFSKLVHTAAKELIENACKFSEKGTTIIVRIFEDSTSRCIRISNQTAHTTAAALNKYRLFEQHHREKAEQQGLGIGLAITNLIASIHKGSIQFDEIEKDSSFREITAVLQLPKL